MTLYLSVVQEHMCVAIIISVYLQQQKVTAYGKCWRGLNLAKWPETAKWRFRIVAWKSMT